MQLFESAREHVPVPRVLDLGAGEGSVTLPLLELGARVTAVDVSAAQLEALRKRCEAFGERLEVRCRTSTDVLESETEPYDVIVANSFIHHVPDYLGMIERALPLLAPGGQFFSFQDPMRYDLLSPFTRRFSTFAYLFWRVRKGDLREGAKRRLRRRRGIFLDDCPQDFEEYHATRNGVDHQAILDLLTRQGFRSRVVMYFSTQSPTFQRLGSRLRLRNTFAILAQRSSA